MIGQPPGIGLAGKGAAEHGVGLAFPLRRVIGTGCCRLRRGIGWLNFLAPNRGLRGVPVGLGEGAACQRAQAVLAHQQATARENSPAE